MATGFVCVWSFVGDRGRRHARGRRRLGERVGVWVKRRNLDDVSGLEEDAGRPPLDDDEVIVVSRRELIAAMVASLTLLGMLLAIQRYNAIRRWSFAAIRGVLKDRYPPVSPSSVGIARFILDGMQSGPEADLRKLSWVNVTQPRLKDRLLLVHLWRSSDVNTMDVVRKLEEVIMPMKKELSGAVATVSVHCSKFDYENERSMVLDASEAMRLRHTVALDKYLRLWKSVGADRWPTVMLLSPNEHRVLVALTEDSLQRLDECLYACLSVYSNAKLQTSSFPLPRVLKSPMTSDVPLLRYPAKLAIDSDGGRLFVCDSGNSRILVTTLEGKFLGQIGGAQGADPIERTDARRHALFSEGENDGHRDGSFEEALFRNPQGLAFNPVSNELAVADAGNDCLRLASFDTRTVRSIHFLDDAPRVRKGKASGGNSHKPSKPWDVTVSAGNVFVALAGSHAIWKLDVFGDFVQLCGSPGKPGRTDADVGYEGALFASPTGICAANGALYVTDSDSSSIREIGLAEKTVRTVVGGDPIFPGNLSAFGDRDGYGSSARLQLPVGISPMTEEKLLVADTYNHKIRSVVPEENECRAFSGTGHAGYKDGPKETARFSSPTDIVYSEKLQRAFVADKNNHCVRVIDCKSGAVSTMRFFGFRTYGENAA